MLFDPKPKRSPSDFFNMEEQLGRLEALLGDPLVRLIVVKGLRRSGKTSLVLVSLNSLGLPYIYIDCRSLEPVSYSAFERALVSGLENLYRRLGLEGKFRALLRRVREVGVAGASIGFEERRSLVVEMLGSLPRDSGVVLVLDEAQFLSPLRGVVRLLAYIYDNVGQVKLIVTGSEVGVLEGFLKLDDPRSPLYGRPYAEVLTGKLGGSEALEFLRLGFEEAGFKARDSDLSEAVDRLDGIIGWLTYYGWYTVKLGSHGEGLAETLRVGSRLVLDELKRFLTTRGVAWPRYLALLRSLAGAPRTWSEAKRALENVLGTRLANNQFTRYLKELEKYGFVEKHGKYYKIVDPILEYALLSGKEV